MKAPTWIAWCMLLVWATLAASFQLAWTHRLVPFGGHLAWWLPDLCLAWLVALAVHVPMRHVWKAAVVLAVVRLGFTQDPPAAVLAGYGWVALLVQALRSGVEVKGVLPRSLIAFVASIGVCVWGQVVHATRHGFQVQGPVTTDELLVMAQRSIPQALITCVVVGALGAVLAHLPGLSPLYQVRRF